MNNVNPPSRFTACILLHTYTQERSRSSAERGFRLQVSLFAWNSLSCWVHVFCGVLAWALREQGSGRGPKPRPGFVIPCRCQSVQLAGLLKIIHHGGIGEGRDIPQVVLALGYAAEDAAHDLAASSLRQVGGEDDLLRPRVRAYGL